MCNFQRWRRALAASSSSAQAAALADDIVGLYKAPEAFYSSNAGDCELARPTLSLGTHSLTHTLSTPLSHRKERDSTQM